MEDSREEEIIPPDFWWMRLNDGDWGAKTFVRRHGEAAGYVPEPGGEILIARRDGPLTTAVILGVVAEIKHRLGTSYVVRVEAFDLCGILPGAEDGPCAFGRKAGPPVMFRAEGFRRPDNLSF